MLAAPPSHGRGAGSRRPRRAGRRRGSVRRRRPAAGSRGRRGRRPDRARAEITEVDHAAEGAALGEDVGRVQVAVQPHRRARPDRRGDGVLPDRADGVRVGDQPHLRGGRESVGERVGVVGQWSPAAVVAQGCPFGSRSVKGRQEGGQGVGRVRGVRHGHAVGGLAGHPGGDDPGTREPLGGLSDALRYGNRQRQARGEDGQPGVLLAQQRVRGRRRPGQPDGEVLAQPPQLVVPAAGTEPHGAVRQVGVLIA
ncbi:hypothetical protein ACVWXB_006701 [Streptomyces sp. TE12347]